MRFCSLGQFVTVTGQFVYLLFIAMNLHTAGVMMRPLFIDLPMPIMTARLLIRPPQLGDGVIVNAAILESFEVLHQFMDWAKEKPTVQESEEHVRLGAANWILKKNEEPYLPLFIFDRKTNEFIGGIGFHHFNWEVPCLEMGYWIRTSQSGKGLMTEAVNALTQYAIKQIGAVRVEIRCDSNNARSKKIPERLGYHLESTLKANRRNLIAGEITDTLVYVKHDLNNLPPLEISY